MLRSIVSVLVCAVGLFGQRNITQSQRVPAEFLYHRVYAVVPMVGSGQAGDFKRPMFAPTASNANHSGVLGYRMQLSDDGKFALVEFVARTSADLKFIDENSGGSAFGSGSRQN